MATNNRLSRIMKLSWDIQRTKRKTRSKAHSAAWAILSNEDITVQYLTRKLNRHKTISPSIAGQFALFA